MQKSKHLSGLTVFLFFVFSLVFPMLFVNKAEAASLQQAYVRLDRMKASTATGGTVCVKTAVADVTESTVAITFPAGFTLDETAGNWSTTTTNLPPTASAWTTIGATATSAVNATRIVTFSSGNLAANTLFCFNFSGTGTLTTSTAGINKTGTITTGGNSSDYATAIVSSPDDQVLITATVPATFTFSLSGNTDTFASNLSTTAQLSNGVTATIATNAAAGWVAWVKSANAALNSVSTGATIATAGSYDDATTSLTAANYGYLLDVTFSDSGTGTGTVTQDAGTGAAGDGYGAEYDGNSSNSGGTLTTSFQPIAASSGTTDNDTVTLKALARITAIQAAATDYTDTLTVVAAGRF